MKRLKNSLSRKPSNSGHTGLFSKVRVTNERIILGVFVIVTTALIVFSVGLFFNGKEKAQNSLPGLTTSPKVNITPYPTIPPITDMSVMINSRRFNPQTVTINHGNHVSFQNISDTPMTLEGTDSKSSMLNIGPIASGDEMILKFDNPGVYTYRNHSKPSEIGTVIIK